LKPYSPQQLLHDIKFSVKFRHFNLEIRDLEGRLIGRFLPFNEERVQDPILHEKLTLWRNRFSVFFFSREKTTPEKTAWYLTELALKDPGRILFLLTLPDGRPVGTEGLRHVEEESCELDNLVRGEMGGHPQLVWHAQRRLLDWALNELGIKRIRCHITKGNVLARRLHESMGFVRKSPGTLTEDDRKKGNLPPETEFEHLELIGGLAEADVHE